jgi:hypothetical protein
MAKPKDQQANTQFEGNLRGGGSKFVMVGNIFSNLYCEIKDESERTAPKEVGCVGARVGQSGGDAWGELCGRFVVCAAAREHEWCHFGVCHVPSRHCPSVPSPSRARPHQIIRRPRRVLYPDEPGPADDGARMFGEEEYDVTEGFGEGMSRGKGAQHCPMHLMSCASNFPPSPRHGY